MQSATPLFAAGNPVLAVLVVQDKATIFAVIAGFLLMLVCVGLVFRRFSKDTSDYFRAGGKATWWLLGGSLFMQNFSAWTFTGAAGAAFQAGWSLPVMFIGTVLAFAANAAFSAGWIRQLRCVTGADLIRLRFGPGMEQFTAVLNMIMGPIYGGVQLYGLAIFTSTLLGVNVNQTIVLLGFVVLFYAALSGAWAVLAADFIKALVLMPISILLAVICLWKMGGIGGLVAAIDRAGLTAAFAPVKSPEIQGTMTGVDANWFTVAFFLAWWASQVINGVSLNNGGKFLSAKDGREARRAAALAGGLFLLGLFIWFVPPMTARLLIAEEVRGMPLANPMEGAYAAIAMHFLPAGLVGLVLVGMCAATMSALDVSLTSLAGNITQNIYPAVCRLLHVTPWEGRARFFLGKFVNTFCALVVIGSALMMARFGRGGIFKILMDVMATIGAPLAMPMLLGLFLRRVPVVAPYASIAAGFCVSLSIYLAPLVSDAKPWAFQSQVAAVIAVSTITFMLVRALRRPDTVMLERETEFFARRDRPVDFAAEIGAGNDGRQLRIVGVFGTTIGLAILLLLIPASSAGHAREICAVALSTLGISGLMIWAGRKLQSTTE
jgi:SSS family solute:Na+ symporter